MARAKTHTGRFLLAAALAGSGGGVAVAATEKSHTAQQNLPIGKEDSFREELPTDYKPTDLVDLSPGLAYEKGKKLLLRSEAAGAMEKMAQDAADKDLDIKVVSAYRDFAHQDRLYKSAIKRYGKNQKMVGRPGRSEHFLGTTIDVTNNNKKHLLQPQFTESAEYRWLEANAEDYGWKFTVRAGKNGRKASQDEPWHLRYVGVAEKPENSDGDAKATAIASADTAPSLRNSTTPAAAAVGEMVDQVRELSDLFSGYAKKSRKAVSSAVKSAKGSNWS